MKKLMLATAILATLCSVANAKSNNHAQKDNSGTSVETVIRANISPLMEGMKVEQISYSNRLSLYEVITPRGVFYTDKKGSYVIFGGAVIDTKTKKDLGAERLEQLGSFEFSKLPFENAIKIVHGNGKRKIVTFEDPNCGYCKKLAPEIKKIDNATIYTFLIPILSPDSMEKSKKMWCATDKSGAFTSYMESGTALPEKTDCDTPIQKNLELQQKLRVMGTPNILFEDNTRFGGYVTSEKIEEKLKSIKN